MKHIHSAIGLFCLGLVAPLTAWGSIFVEPAWENSTASASVAIWSGGNVSSIPPQTTNDVPPSANGIVLMESAIGQITSPLGYPQAVEDLRSAANTARVAAQPYRFTQGPSGVQTNGAVTWSLVFPGGFDPLAGQVYPAGVANPTFFPAQLDSAEYAARALLRINPLDQSGARLLLALIYDRMLPQQFCGSLAVTYADKARLIGQNAVLQELPALSLATGYFRSTCDLFGTLMSNPLDATLVEGLSPISGAVTNELNQLVDGFLRGLDLYGQTTFNTLELRNFADFRDPVQGDPMPLSLLSDIDNAAVDISLRLLLVSPFANLPVYTFSKATQVESRVRDLQRLHASILRGRVAFIAGAATDSSDNSPDRRYSELTTDYVPIFPPEPSAPGNSSFDRALQLARTFQQHAAGLEASEMQAIDQVLQRNYDYRVQLNGLTNQYMGELETLCGLGIDQAGQSYVDVYFGGLPPETRQGFGDQILTNAYSYDPSHAGTIYQQWVAVKQAGTNLDLAQIQLFNTLAQMTNAQYVADLIASGQRSLAELILNNGQRVAGLDVQKGEIQAEEALKSGRIQADAAMAASAVSALKDAFTGSNVFNNLVDSGTALANGFITAGADMSVGEAQAEADRQLADIEAQITRIDASERAAIQYESADETMLRLSENLNNLRLTANAQEVSIRLAAQQLDQEHAKLASMFARVAYLLRAWAGSASLLALNPQLTDNLLVERNAAMENGDDEFVLAQQWAFLAALAYGYLDNSPSQGSAPTIRDVLAKRNATDLGVVLDKLDSANSLLKLLYQQSAAFRTPTFSVRSSFFQANRTADAGTNLVIVGYEPTPYGTNAAASDAAWRQFLRSNIGVNQSGVPYLRIVFSTGLASSLIGTNQANPLFSCTEFGSLIFSGTDANNNQYKGVQVNFATAGLAFSNATPTVSVQLSQLGGSTIRRVGFGNTTGDPIQSVRVFNLGDYAAVFEASLNSLNSSPGTADFQERSPANDQWELVVYRDAGPNNPTLLDSIDKIQDIQVRLGIRGFTDQVAARLCQH